MMWNRRQVLVGAASVVAARAVAGAEGELAVLDVASAGSFRQMVEGPLKDAAAKTLGLSLRSHAQGADAVARSIVDGTLQADVFVPITAGPMRTVFAGGKADVAVPIARTEMVIVYSPKSRFAARFEAAREGKEVWWKVLETPGVKIARSDPASDPGGRNIIL
jgi:molybdate/tungstate transport system substrate-binding protein